MKKPKLLIQIAKPNTLKTIGGYLYSLLEGILPFKLSRNSLKGIYNYLVIDQNISTSGQPTQAQFLSIQQAGFQQIVNLAPHNAENALPDEASYLSGIGLPYQHIPVDFSNPSQMDYEKFVHAMNDNIDRKVWIHCAANMRVSAFIYRYRCAELGVDPSSAKRDLEKIWEPFGVWAKFVNNTQYQNTDKS